MRHAVLAALYAVGAIVAIAAAISDSMEGAWRVLGDARGGVAPADRHLAVGGAAHRHDRDRRGFVPLVLGGGSMRVALYRSRSDRERALATLFLPTIVLLTIETASYNVRFGGPEVIHNRYLFYIVPLLLVGTAAAVSSAPRKPLAIAAGCIVVFFAATASALDLQPFAGLNVDSPGSVVSTAWATCPAEWGRRRSSPFAALVLGGALVLGVLLAPRTALRRRRLRPARRLLDNRALRGR